MTITAPLLALLIGFAAGFAHFATLRRVTDLYLSGKSSARAAILQIARLAGLAVLLVALAKFGTAPLLAGALGILAARAMVLRRARKEA